MNREVIEKIKKAAKDTNSAAAIFSIAASIVECGCLIALACCKDEKKGDAKKKG